MLCRSFRHHQVLREAQTGSALGSGQPGRREDGQIKQELPPGPITITWNVCSLGSTLAM